MKHTIPSSGVTVDISSKKQYIKMKCTHVIQSGKHKGDFCGKRSVQLTYCTTHIKCHKDEVDREREIEEKNKATEKRKLEDVFMEQEEKVKKFRKTMGTTKDEFLDAIGMWNFPRDPPVCKSASDTVVDFLEYAKLAICIGNSLVSGDFFMHPYWFAGNTTFDLIHEFKIRGYVAMGSDKLIYIKTYNTSDDMRKICENRDRFPNNE